MKSGFLQFQHSNIHYLRFGNGKNVVICFHGYGESAAHFQFLGEKIKDEFTLIALDLPFHGVTDWDDNALDEIKLHTIINQILANEQLSTEKLVLMGFSLGGRLALSLYQAMADRVQRLVLLAPDGLKLNFWYWLSTQTIIGNKLFRWTMQSPGWFLTMLRIANKLSLINRSIYKFVDYYIHDERVRKELYNRWTCMRKCRPSIPVVQSQVRKNATTVRLLYGKHDRIILSSPGLRFIHGLPTASMTMLDCGHQVLHPKNANTLMNALID